MCWLHDTIHLATVTLQESRYFGGFVKGGPESSLRQFKLHRALQILSSSPSDSLIETSIIAVIQSIYK